MTTSTMTTTTVKRDHAQSASRLLVLVGLDVAREELNRIAFATDSPDWRDVQAADFLDAAHDLLAVRFAKGGEP